MRIGPLTLENICDVVDHLSGESQKELNFLKRTREDFILKFIGMTGKPFTASFWDEKNRCYFAVVALESLGNMRWKTYFAGTEEGMKYNLLSLTKFLKQFTSEMVKNGGEIIILSPFDEGFSVDWYKSLGFRNGNREGNLFRFVKP